jgi:hypothetical protein
MHVDAAWKVEQLADALGAARTAITGQVPVVRPRLHSERGAKPSHARAAGAAAGAAAPTLAAAAGTGTGDRQAEGGGHETGGHETAPG